MKKTDVFAKTKKPKDASDKADAALRSEAAVYSRLIANPDFKEFFFMLTHELCGFGDDLSPVDEWHQGLRAASAFIRRKMLLADGAVDFFAELQTRYLAGVRKGIADAAQRTTQNERP